MPGRAEDPGVQLQPGNDPAVAGEPVNLRDTHHRELVSIDVQSQLSHLAGRAERLCLGHAEVGQFG